ncbi:hypothetical protein Bhyg_16444, partial [Pseudolycoriella hygida]
MKLIISSLLLGVLFAPSAYSEECKEQSGTKIITVSPTFIPILGNKPIKVEGPFLNGATSVQFRFNDVTQITVNATISSNNVATCVAPFFYLNVTGEVKLAITTITTIQTFETIIKISAVSCVRPAIPTNGYAEASNYSEGSSAKLVCNKDFEIKGNPTVTCSKDSRGELIWSGSFGTCEKANKCANENKWLEFLCESGIQG